MNIRKLLLTLHLVTGLVSAVVLLLLGLSGSVLVFEPELEHWLNAPLEKVQGEGAQRDVALAQLPLDTLAARLEQAHPGTKLTAVFPAAEPGLTCHVTLRGVEKGNNLGLAVDPCTGAEQGRLDTANTLLRTVHQFHTRLLLGETGKLITGIGAACLLVLSLTGIVIWFPRKLLKMGWSESGRRRNFELHSVLGFWSSAFMLIFAVTGMVIHWEEPARTFLNRIAGGLEPVMKKPAAPAAGAVAISAGRAQDIALATVPGARVTGISGLGDVKNAIRVTMKFPEDRTPAGRTNLYLDPTTGTVLFAQTSRTAPLGTRVVKLWNREVHTGDIFGLPTRIVACVASLCLPLLALSGPLIWWGRVRRSRKSED